MEAPVDVVKADILDLVHDSIVVRDMSGRVTGWNAAAETLYGISRAEAIGRLFLDLVHHRDQARLDEAEARLSEDGAWEGELVRIDRGGRERRMDLRWSRREDVERGIEIVVETGRDVSDRQAAEDSAKLTEYRYRNLFQAMSVAFWEVDFNGVGALLLPLREAGIDLRDHLAAHPDLVREAMRRSKVVDVNAKALALFDAASPETVIGGDVERFWSDESLPVFAEALVETFEKRPHMLTQTRLRDMQGRPLDVLFTVSWSPESRRRGLLLIGIIDISERLKAERMVREMQAEFAHSARVSTLGELTASIAHEVNQPLAAICTNGEASLRWLARPQPDLEEVRTLSARMVADARRAADIIARIRDMASRRAPELVLCRLDTMIDETLNFLGFEIGRRDVSVDVAIASGLPPVEADRTQIQQVLVNLLMNALHAVEGVGAGGGRVLIRAMPEGAFVRVEVEDNGGGVPAELAPHLFDGFFTTKESGLGIGLSLSRSIIEAHGGAIRFENGPDGARFAFRLAASAERSEPIPGAPLQVA